MSADCLKPAKRVRKARRNGNGKIPKPERQPSRTLVALQLLSERPWSVGCGWTLGTHSDTAIILRDLATRELSARSVNERGRALFIITDKGRRTLRLLKQRQGL